MFMRGDNETNPKARGRGEQRVILFNRPKRAQVSQVRLELKMTPQVG